MPRKVKRPEEWERRADEKFEAQSPEVTSKVRTVREGPKEPREPQCPKSERGKKEPISREQTDRELVPSVDRVPGKDECCENDSADFAILGDGEEERSRSDIASAAFGHESVRGAYQELGAAGFYELKGASYVNPHEDVLTEAIHMALDEWHGSALPMPQRSLDLACGSGEATLALEAWLQKVAAKGLVEAADPYTFEAFERRLGRKCHRWSFENIAQGVMEQEPIYDLVLCSFALHLLDRSWIACTLDSLARRARFLIVATPHKRPVIEKRFGWEQLEELLHQRVRIRLYRSLSVE